MTKCDWKNCEGHLGKFDSCRDEVLHEWALDSGDGTGDVEFDGFVTLVHLDVAETYTSEWAVPNHLNGLTVPAGTYLVHSANSGAVTVTSYETPELARSAYAVFDKAYGEWVDQDD